MAKPWEKVRNALLHNYDTTTNLASKVIFVDLIGNPLLPTCAS